MGVTEAEGSGRQRRRLAVRLALLAVLLAVGWLILIGRDGVLGGIGLVAFAQGVGLAVAVPRFAAGRNLRSRS